MNGKLLTGDTIKGMSQYRSPISRLVEKWLSRDRDDRKVIIGISLGFVAFFSIAAWLYGTSEGREVFLWLTA